MLCTWRYRKVAVLLGLGTKTPWLGLEKDIGECTRSGQERKIGSSNRANKNEPEKLNFFCYLSHKAGINDYKTLTMWIQNGLITISQKKRHSCREDLCRLSEPSSWRLHIVTIAKTGTSKGKMEKITSNMFILPKSTVYSDCAKLSHLIWPWYIETLQNATSGSFN